MKWIWVWNLNRKTVVNGEKKSLPYLYDIIISCHHHCFPAGEEIVFPEKKTKIMFFSNQTRLFKSECEDGEITAECECR